MDSPFCARRDPHPVMALRPLLARLLCLIRIKYALINGKALWGSTPP